MPRRTNQSNATNSKDKIPYSRFQQAVLAIQQKWEKEGLVHYVPLNSASWTAKDWKTSLERDIDEKAWEEQSLEVQSRVCGSLERSRDRNDEADIFSGMFPSLERLRGTVGSKRIVFKGQNRNSWLRNQVCREIHRFCETSTSSSGNIRPSQDEFDSALSALRDTIKQYRTLHQTESSLDFASRYWNGNIENAQKQRVIDVLKACHTMLERAVAGDVPHYVLLSFIPVQSQFRDLFADNSEPRLDAPRSSRSPPSDSSDSVAFSHFEEAVHAIRKNWEEQWTQLDPPPPWSPVDWAAALITAMEPVWEAQTPEARAKVIRFLATTELELNFASRNFPSFERLCFCSRDRLQVGSRKDKPSWLHNRVFNHLQSLCTSPRSIMSHHSNIAELREQREAHQRNFESALSKLDSSTQSTIEEQINRLVTLAREYWKRHHNESFRLRIITAVNAAHAMLKEANDNGVVYMLLRYYLPTSDEFAELCGVTDRTAIAPSAFVVQHRRSVSPPGHPTSRVSLSLASTHGLLDAISSAYLSESSEGDHAVAILNSLVASCRGENNLHLQWLLSSIYEMAPEDGLPSLNHLPINSEDLDDLYSYSQGHATEGADRPRPPNFSFYDFQNYNTI